MATTSTSEITYDNFLLSPLIAPHGGHFPGHAELPGDPIPEVPHAEHDDERLYQPKRTGLHDFAENNGGSQQYETDLDIKFALQCRTHPFRNADGIADKQAEGHGEKHAFESGGIFNDRRGGYVLSA